QRHVLAANCIHCDHNSAACDGTKTVSAKRQFVGPRNQVREGVAARVVGLRRELLGCGRISDLDTSPWHNRSGGVLNDAGQRSVQYLRGDGKRRGKRYCKNESESIHRTTSKPKIFLIISVAVAYVKLSHPAPRLCWHVMNRFLFPKMAQAIAIAAIAA